MMKRDPLYVGGRWAAPSTTRTLEVHSPHDGRTVGVVPEAGSADTDAALVAAQRALDSGWARTTGAERADVRRRLTVGLQARNAELA